MAACTRVHAAGVDRPLTNADRTRLDRLCTHLRWHRYRLLALAYRVEPDSLTLDEPGMVLVGILPSTTRHAPTPPRRWPRSRTTGYARSWSPVTPR